MSLNLGERGDGDLREGVAYQAGEDLGLVGGGRGARDLTLVPGIGDELNGEL